MPKLKPNPASLLTSLTKSSAEARLAALAGVDIVSTQPPERFGNSQSGEPEMPEKAIDLPIVKSAAATIEVGMLLTVPIDDLLDGPFNARKFYVKARIDEIAADMKEFGQRVPINAYYDDSQRLIIDDGHYRSRAARQAGIKTLIVQIIPPPTSPLEGFKRSRLSNKNRNDQSILDDAFRLKDLAESFNLTQRALGEELGYDEVDTSKLMALTRLTENIILTVMVDPTLLTKRFLYNLSLYFDRKGETATLQLAAAAVKEGMSARELESRVKNAEHGFKEKPRSEKFTLEKGDAKGFIKTFPSGRVELRLDGLTDDEQSTVMDRLRQILS